MTSPGAISKERPFCVRFAKPADAQTISQLYVRTYTPAGGGTAQQHYPFPQIMERDKVVELILSGTVVWVVAEARDGAVIGSAAAVRNIGAPNDRIAEIFGVAVEQTWQRQGVGSALLKQLQIDLANIADFVLCEARTAEAGGWKAARNAGLQPVGFEPYAHAMPIGFESMVLTVSWSLSRPEEPHEVSLIENTKAVQRIAETVHRRPRALLSARAEASARSPKRGVPLGAVETHRDDTHGSVWYARLTGRRSSIVEFWPLHGEEALLQRFEHAYYVASAGASNIAAARVFCDHTDGRARILGMRASLDGFECQFLEGVVDELLRCCKGKPLVVIVCVRAGEKAVQTRLESLDFFPTAYFPQMISSPAGREDVIQYTRLFGRSWAESIRSVTAMDWPEAREIIDQVVLTPSA